MTVYPTTEFNTDPDSLLSEYFSVIRFHAETLLKRLPRTIEIEELINAGVVGLLEGAHRFDPGMGVDFKTFISFRVKGAMIDFLRSHDWLPRTLRGAATDIQKVMAELERLHGRPASEEMIADALGISLEEYRKRLQQVHQMSVISFDDLPTHDDEDANQVFNLVAADASYEPERRVALVEFVEALASGIARLPDREKVILTLYYFDEFTMKEIALIMNLTESRVSQIHSQLVLRLRSLMGLD